MLTSWLISLPLTCCVSEVFPRQYDNFLFVRRLTGDCCFAETTCAHEPDRGSGFVTLDGRIYDRTRRMRQWLKLTKSKDRRTAADSSAHRRGSRSPTLLLLITGG
ncbi:hypothetical protein PVAP13_2KG203451 [Panicum virgatum]|uniref:Secreted protein n=1 Tax=Panicum virgatum TaxID=38727 RepID=A0A8T0WEC1_PANVG|nr:hypothetical protein PVAP13_2KG203451 [Panicum virgatum]